MPFFWNWPSLVVEILSGALLALILAPWPLVFRLPLIVGVSLFYESTLDRNGWDLKDVLQRFIGVALIEGWRLFVLITLLSMPPRVPSPTCSLALGCRDVFNHIIDHRSGVDQTYSDAPFRTTTGPRSPQSPNGVPLARV